MSKKVRYVYLQPGQVPPQEKPQPKHKQPAPAPQSKQPTATKRGGMDGLTVFLLLAIAVMWAWGAIA